MERRISAQKKDKLMRKRLRYKNLTKNRFKPRQKREAWFAAFGTLLHDAFGVATDGNIENLSDDISSLQGSLLPNVVSDSTRIYESPIQDLQREKNYYRPDYHLQ